VSIGKINKKKLSRNLRTRNAPLRVLPMAPWFRTRHRLTQGKEVAKTPTEQIPTSISHPMLQCTIEDVHCAASKRVKKLSRHRPMTIRPFLRARLTMSALRWIFLLIFVYLAAGTIIVMIQEGTEPLKNIVIYSIMGFFTFFMGYLGWIVARDVLEVFSGKKTAQNEAEVQA
jgi:hypothetical protein